jgi:hypothetical protein
MCGLTTTSAAEFLGEEKEALEAWRSGREQAPYLVWWRLAQLYCDMQIEADRIFMSLNPETSGDIGSAAKDRQAEFPAGSVEKIHAMALMLALAVDDRDVEGLADIESHPLWKRHH